MSIPAERSTPRCQEHQHPINTELFMTPADHNGDAADGTRAPDDAQIAALLDMFDAAVSDDLAESSRHGAMLIDPDALARDLGSPDFPFVDDEGTSREDAQRRAFLRRYLDQPHGLYRRHLVADRATVARLEQLAADTPNGHDAVEVILRAATLSLHTGMPLRSPPLLVVGPPGTGKTRLAAGLAKALGTTMMCIDGGMTSEPSPFSGNHVSFRGSSPSKVARALLDGPTTGPLIQVEEIDKISSYNQSVQPLTALLTLFEPSTASRFVDNYLELPIRADGVVWIATANDISGLPAPLLDRMVVVTMPALTRCETEIAVRRMFSELLAANGLPAADLPDAAVDLLAFTGLRQAQRVLALALGPALAAGRPAPNRGDIAAALRLVLEPEPKRIGFVR